MTNMDRRQFISHSTSAAALSFAYGGSAAGLAMAQGKASGPLRVLSENQADTFAAWCDELAIGAAQAGVARFVDKYLAEPYGDCLLLLRYLQNPPYTDFYIGGIAGVNQESEARFSKPFLALEPPQRKSIVEAAATSSTKAWLKPNPNFFYFVSRSDAVDVVYGTVAGFRNLDVPYLPHIIPTEPW